MSTLLSHSPASIVEAFDEINSGQLTNTIFSNANVVMLNKDTYYQLIEKTESKVRETAGDSVVLDKKYYAMLIEHIESLTKQLEIANKVKYVKILD